MSYVRVTTSESLAVVRLERGKVNAINEAVVDELRSAFGRLLADPAVRAVVLTGTRPFFSFGFDIPELYDYPREEFTSFLRKFTNFTRHLFVYPRPIVAAINGHAVAGGCILATACDHRVMVSGKAKISLNELTFGSTIFQSAIELMRYWVGSRSAEVIVFGGGMYSAEQARDLGLIDTVTDADSLSDLAAELAERLCGRNPEAFAHAKSMLRQPIIDRILKYEEQSIKKFVDIWYSDRVRENLQKITIRN
jgi:3,2-trans-enoyl-CoA isomerase